VVNNRGLPHEALLMSKLADLIWKNAEVLRGAFKENEYRKVILPFTILRRLDCVLAPTRDAILARHQAIRHKGYDLDKMLTLTTALTHELAESAPFAVSTRFARRGGQIAGSGRQSGACDAGGVGSIRRLSRGRGISGTNARRACFPARSVPRLAGGFGQARTRLLELQQERFGEKHTHPCRIEPGGGAGIPDEATKSTAHAEFLIQTAQLPSEPCQGIEHMRQAHEEAMANPGTTRGRDCRSSFRK